MRDRRVDRDDEIDESKDGRCIREIIELRAELRHARFARQQFRVSIAQFALNADKMHRSRRPERSETGERNRAVSVVHVLGISGPTSAIRGRPKASRRGRHFAICTSSAPI